MLTSRSSRVGKLVLWWWSAAEFRRWHGAAAAFRLPAWCCACSRHALAPLVRAQGLGVLRHACAGLAFTFRTRAGRARARRRGVLPFAGYSRAVRVPLPALLTTARTAVGVLPTCVSPSCARTSPIAAPANKSLEPTAYAWQNVANFHGYRAPVARAQVTGGGSPQAFARFRGPT